MIKAIVKNYLRNSMGQVRLNGLAMLSIEASRAKVMDVDQLIDPNFFPEHSSVFS